METKRKKRSSRRIFVGDIPIGGNAPVVVQSMTNTDTRDISSTVDQIRRLSEAGCEIVRLAIPDEKAVDALAKIKGMVEPPLIADIHFDYRLAISSIKAGADGLRINPGNIGDYKKVEKIIDYAGERNIPLRIGVNSGSLPRHIIKKYGHPTPEAMVETALEHIRFFENLNFHNMKISLKSSNVLNTISAYEKLSEECDYPLHLGITEAGTLISGTVKNAIGIGILLFQGIGDTIRVSLSRDPVEEVKAAYEILRALDLRHRGPEIISCPTCGRCEIDLFHIIETVERGLQGIEASPKVAIMGCIVNGPGEAREADIGIAGGRGQGVLFKKGEIVDKFPEEELAGALIREVRNFINNG
ncbi:MAG: flavodoxin-dependent (E)-4-hydroxy-3-methylbut-2-enyl-diphosphate synthase [Deltaproteobacteria bacterium]|nr:flavodoxin-dependent (E)-4-hydroxy-3-methylbut-2-enyl-diphosphate synthase [Deltaproteobacteria bacterium]